MRQEVAAAWVVLLLTGTLSDLFLVSGSSRSMGRPKSGFKPKKGLSNKAKIAVAGAAGVAGGMMLGSVLSAGRSERIPQSNRYQKINGTWVDTWSNGGVVYPLGSLSLCLLSVPEYIAIHHSPLPTTHPTISRPSDFVSS